MKNIAIRIALALAAVLMIEVLAVSVDVVGVSGLDGKSEIRANHFGVPFRSLLLRTQRFESQLHADTTQLRLLPWRATGDLAMALAAVAAIACLLRFWCARRIAIGFGLCLVLGLLLDVFLRSFQNDDMALWHLLGFASLVAVAVSATARTRPFTSTLLSLVTFYGLLFFVQRACELLVPSGVHPADMSWVENVIFPGILLAITYALCSAWFGIRVFIKRRNNTNVPTTASTSISNSARGIGQL